MTTTINEALFNVLKSFGYDGALPDMYREYLLEETGSDLRAIQDLERELLASYGYSGAINEMWFSYLRTAGYTNTLQEMLYAFWADAEGFTQLRIPLTHSLIPSWGDAIPRYTGGVATGSGVKDYEGVLRMRGANEAPFVGARRVKNNFTFSENNTNAAYNQATVTTTATTIIYGAAKPSQFYRNVLGSGTTVTAVGNTYVAQVKVSGVAGNKINFYVMNGATSRGSAVQITLSATPTVYSLAYTVTNAEAIYVWLMPDDFLGLTVGTLSQTVTATQWQCEDITGRTDQTTPSEYVSVGVLSDPWHGSGVDGVKHFSTDLSGNPIPAATLIGYTPEEARTNLVLQSNSLATTWVATGPAPVQNAIGPDGATSAWTLTDNSAANFCQLTITPANLTAATYTLSGFVKKTTGAQSSYPALYCYTGTTIAICTIDTSNGVATAWTAYTGNSIATGLVASCASFNDDYWRVQMSWTATVAAWNVLLIPAGTTNATQSTGTLAVAVTGTAVFYGIQLELGSSASSYIPTTTVAIARVKDTESYTTSGVIDDDAGTVALSFTPNHSPVGTIALWGTYVDADNYTAILHDATNVIFRQRIAGVNTDATKALAFVSGTTYKICASWGALGQTIYVDGAAGTPHANTTAAQIAATMQLGADGNSGQQPNAGIGDFRIWLRQLSASEQGAITA